ncbi:60S ribosomal protein L24 [Thelohanellus kitauei]|uniref:Large ribosomal subunit protein eL24 n=1 Tax=Thelohanellus kitauei TaxID=669202 RepID=A0A0C2NGV7_THEKT|nr:60S ribosomal protein L24 [Thelohanellus kitauei]
MSQVKVYVRTELCNFSGYKIYPGHGVRYVRADGKLLTFMTKKSESLFKDKKNPRKVSWTVLYRKQHKKGHIEESQKKKTADVRKAQRDTAIKLAKEQIKEKREKKKLVKQEQQARQTQKNVKHQVKDKVKQPPAPKIRMGGKR